MIKTYALNILVQCLFNEGVSEDSRRSIIDSQKPVKCGRVMLYRRTEFIYCSVLYSKVPSLGLSQCPRLNPSLSLLWTLTRDRCDTWPHVILFLLNVKNVRQRNTGVPGQQSFHWQIERFWLKIVWRSHLKMITGF